MSSAPTSRSSEAPTGSSTIRAGRAAPAPGLVRPVRAGRVGRRGVAGEPAARRRRPPPACSAGSARTAVDLAVPFSPRTSTPPTAGDTALSSSAEPQVVLPDDGGEGIRVLTKSVVDDGRPSSCASVTSRGGVGRRTEAWLSPSRRRVAGPPAPRPPASWRSRRHERQPLRRALLDQPQQRVRVRVLLDQIAQPVQLLLAQRPEAGVRRRHEAPARGGRDPRAGRPAGSRRSPASRASACPRPRRPGSRPGSVLARTRSPPALRRPRGGSRTPPPARRAPRRPAGPGSSPARTAPAPAAARARRPCPARDSTSSSMRSPSIWKPPQMPSTGRPSAARRGERVRQPALAQPLQRPHRAAGAGHTTRSASASSSARSTNRTTTPGSAASASTSVKFDISGTAHDGDPQHVLAVRRARRPTRAPRRAATPAARPPRRCRGRARKGSTP